MPIYGRRDLEGDLDRAPVLDLSERGPMIIPNVEIVQAMFELDPSASQMLLPRALGPTIPPSVTIVVWRCNQGPLGDLALAQIRIGCRAGISPRAFLLASYCDGDAAIDTLQQRWGFDCAKACVELQASSERVTASVGDPARPFVAVSLLEPRPIAPASLFYTSNLNLVRVANDGEPLGRLAEVDPAYTFHRALRGRPRIDRFEPHANFAEAALVHPISASYAICDLTLTSVRFLVDPERPALRGTTRVLS